MSYIDRLFEAKEHVFQLWATSGCYNEQLHRVWVILTTEYRRELRKLARN